MKATKERKIHILISLSILAQMMVVSSCISINGKIAQIKIAKIILLNRSTSISKKFVFFDQMR